MPPLALFRLGLSSSLLPEAQLLYPGALECSQIALLDHLQKMEACCYTSSKGGSVRMQVLTAHATNQPVAEPDGQHNAGINIHGNNSSSSVCSNSWQLLLQIQQQAATVSLQHAAGVVSAALLLAYASDLCAFMQWAAKQVKVSALDAQVEWLMGAPAGT